MSVQTLARRIRTRLHDTDSIAYDDAEILDCINNGVRFIRRIIANLRPALLLSEVEGVLEAGTRSITLEKRPTKIINVTAGDRLIKSEEFFTGKKIYHDFDKIFRNHNPIYNRHEKNTYSERALHQTEMAFIVQRPSDAEGTPREFFLTGSQTLNFFPIPNRPTKYTVRTVDDIEEIEWTGKSPLLTEYDDFLIEYAAIRLSVGNEYDMTQETQLMANIVAQIQALLIPPPAGVLTKSYWGSRRSKAGGW
ncbi:MAG: hypothetical protein IJ685_10005 [Selenomonadaceae bacterium]|nr:hypothetical protein [Selenomonadaceae bacterium]